MFDYTKVNEMFDVTKVNEAVDTVVNKTEENVTKMTGYIQDAKAKELVEALNTAGFAVARSAITAGREVAETFSKAFALSK